MTGICGHIPGVTCSNCHPWQNPLTVTHPWPPWSSTPPDRYAANEAKQREDAWQSRDADNEAQVRRVLGMGGDLRAEAERMPEVSLEWNANDEGPPCIDFTCLCGHWRHLCNGPDWITEGHGQAPGVKCVKCGTAWSLYRVRITAMIREEAEPDTPSGRAFTARDKDATDAVHAKQRALVEAVAAANKAEEVKRQLREVLGAGRWSGWRRLRKDERDPLEEDDWGDRLGGKGSRWTRRASLWCKESCPCHEGSWELDQIDRFDGPLTFAPKPAPQATGDDPSASAPLWCPECGHHIDDHHDGVCVTLCECLALPSQIAQALITDAVTAEREG